MNGAAITRPCTGCKKHFIGVAPGLCPACEKDSAIYKASRKNGDPREFLPYPELLDQWRRRRAECRDFKKAAGGMPRLQKGGGLFRNGSGGMGASGTGKNLSVGCPKFLECRP